MFFAIKRIASSFALLACSAPRLPAQTFPIWDGSTLIQSVENLDDKPIGGLKGVRFEGPGGKLLKTISLPPTALIRDYLDGSLYAWGGHFVRDEETKAAKHFTHNLWRHEEGGTWRLDATIDAPRPTFFGILPLRDGRYLVRAAPLAVEDEDGVCLFGVYKKNRNNELVFEKPATEILFRPSGKTHLGLSTGYVSRAGSKIIFYYPGVGWFFVFSAEDGKLLKRASIFPEITEGALFVGKGFGNVGIGLGACLRQNGHITCATRSKGYIVNGMELYPQPSLSDLGLSPGDMDSPTPAQFQSMREKTREVNEKRDRRWPELLWWDFDPDTGKITKMPTPEGFPETLGDSPGSGHWRITADDALVMLDGAGNPVGPSKKPRKLLGLFDFK